MDQDITFSEDSHPNYFNLIYIRKVLIGLLVQVLISSCIALSFSLIHPLYVFVEKRFWLAIAVKVALVLTAVALFRVKEIAKNLILLSIFAGLFTIFFGSMFGVVLSLLDQKFVVMILYFFVSIHVVSVLYSISEKEAFNVRNGIIYMFYISLVNVSVFIVVASYEKLFLFFVPIAVGLYGFFLIFHFNNVIEGKSRKTKNDRYILVVLSVYIELFLLKFYILAWLKNKHKKRLTKENLIKGPTSEMKTFKPSPV
ncbi:unnamed protein product [Blepharisma stoltei]|uniref:Uncharacterized protein n=1 Tax=Blepharisma stoltei TaxID=1481888 RepID=A0AAU9J569_9CILI|nr:unnamed protein product [Blepharisma stoltei]